jgi:hypothetical protein
VILRSKPSAKTLGITAVELDTGRPRNGLSLSRCSSIGKGVHLEGALTLSTERREYMLLLFFPKRLSLPGEEVQEKYKRRIKAAVGH